MEGNYREGKRKKMKKRVGWNDTDQQEVTLRRREVQSVERERRIPVSRERKRVNR